MIDARHLKAIRGYWIPRRDRALAVGLLAVMRLIRRPH